ncbi:hypothetical protein AV926_11350 [Myroides marinus]|uniref:Uncharacterized protein n=1 Tax=Myroides marinus TaxID=703342 RepID=A0A165RXV3_9FLAO|nr:hypothetical protein [Myroides marinus]KUF47187.1 hypothetical protein AS361_14275 [Myroides marinus]KZE79768.1 hypothetical protein AV926_11350 [Myroides marinus]
MKYIIGFIACVVVLTTALYIVLGFWDISLFDPQYLTNTYKTIGVIGVVAILLILIVSFFFKANHKGYDTSKGNVAHPQK